MKKAVFVFQTSRQGLELASRANSKIVLFESTLQLSEVKAVSGLPDFKDKVKFPISFALQKNSGIFEMTKIYLGKV